MNKSPGLLGRKIGMTQLFDGDGNCLPVTVVEAGPCAVVQVKTTDSDGYSAVQLGLDPRKDKHTTKAQKGHFDKAGVSPKRLVREIRLENDPEFTPGQEVTIGDFFEEGMLDQIQQGLGEKVAPRNISIPWFAEREVITDGG